ncbi:ABC transporter permease [Agrococcus jejuensis]|uniref:Peptide/nickel transport system permease protein n=1 Tax=Agrococcus jejuensis TaxID=399736 RepID=A0A1G8C770_9MICO|nr:ABC transporter permease [Agrococcus jejuensis]SDH41265.1 peptide/nickel transport system permease protein [Agrococcus jejuensis]
MVMPQSTAAQAATPAPPRRAGNGLALLLHNRKAMAGLIMLALFTLMAVLGPIVAPYDPSATGPDSLQPPSPAHLLGTTNLGEDILSQLLVGARGVALVALISGVIATVMAVLVGVTAGYLSGAADDVLSALTNVFLVLPGLPLVIIVASQVGGSTLLIAVVIAITGWAWGARVLRAQTLSLRRRDFVLAAKASGESTWRIIVVEMLPNLMALIASSFVGTVTAAVLAQITLAFIGVTSISDWNWGTILFWAQSNQALARGAWWWFVPAGLAIALLGTALALLNFGIDEIVNPRLRSAADTARALRRRGLKVRATQAAVVSTADLGDGVGSADPEDVDAGAGEGVDAGGGARSGDPGTPPAASRPREGEAATSDAGESSDDASRP